MRTLNIIGCGNVGKTLGYLLAKKAGYQIQDILCRSMSSSLSSQAFLQSGHALCDYHDLRPADAVLLTVTDDQLPNAILSLLKSDSIRKSTLVFHCSGTFSHEILAPLFALGANAASIHPLKSFNTPTHDSESLRGIFCALEGQESACNQLERDFDKLSARVVRVKTHNKVFYHIASIFSCNYFVTLLDHALQLLEKNDIPRDQGILMLEPLVLGALNQVKEYGTLNALTGPIARGDAQLVGMQYRILQESDTLTAKLYKILGELTVDLAAQSGKLDVEMMRSQFVEKEEG